MSRTLRLLAAAALALPAVAFGQDARPVGALVRPEAEDFVCLVDGTFLPGAVEETASDLKLAAADGARREFPKSDVSLAVSGGKSIHRGEESGIHAAWRAWLRAQHTAKLPGGRFADADEAGKKAYLDDMLAAADRCSKRKMKYAAAALLGDALAAGLWTDDMQSRALQWEPVEFPFQPEDEERAKLFAAWAREIVPMGGSFILRNDPLGNSDLSVTWTQNVVALRTRNLVIRSRVTEASLVGECLRQGEATVRGLEHLLGTRGAGTDDPLEIRLYRDRKEYLEDTSSGRAMLWSAGYFNPGSGLSHFYLDVNPVTGKLDVEELHRVLSHELTHHWIERRLHRGGRSYGMQPGYWIVEGFAGYVETQSRDFQKGDFTFDDEKFHHLFETQVLRKQRKMIPMAKIIDLSGKDFHSGPREQIGAFYAQSCALSFWFMNKKGPEGRKRLLEYLERYYEGKFWDLPPQDDFGRRDIKVEDGKPVLQTWKMLGYDSAEALENEFGAFLDGLSGGGGKTPKK